MRIPSLLRAGLIVALAAAAPFSLNAQSAPVTATARQLMALGPRASEQFVEITGKVSRYDGDRAFYLEDDYGVGIRIVVSGERPARDLRVAVVGMVSVDSDKNPYIVAERIVDPNKPVAPTNPVEAAPTDSDTDGVPDGADACPGTTRGTVIGPNGCPLPVFERYKTAILAAIGVLALALGMAVALRRTTPAPVPPIPGTPSVPGAAGNPVDIDEGKTIRVARPDSSQGTLQILPGRLEITGGGDQGRLPDIRFVRDPIALGDPEMTFGRTGNVSPTHMILKSQTVSRLHAKMRFSGGQWSIQNFSDTNPLLLNGQPLRVEAPPAKLKSGDTIEMGEVSFRFHDR
jgi:hypothetical protein